MSFLELIVNPVVGCLFHPTHFHLDLLGPDHQVVLEEYLDQQEYNDECERTADPPLAVCSVGDVEGLLGRPSA